MNPVGWSGGVRSALALVRSKKFRQGRIFAAVIRP